MNVDIRKLRNDNRLKQSELAELLDVKQPYISAIESGRLEISSEVLERLKTKFPDFQIYESDKSNIETPEDSIEIDIKDEDKETILLKIIAEQLKSIKQKDTQISTLLRMIDECNKKIDETKI